MTYASNIPVGSYGILQQEVSESALDDAVEQVRNLGYAIVDSGYTAAELRSLCVEFDRTREQYVKRYGEAKLKSVDEFYTVRSPLTHGGEIFLELALNE